jgi:hypothetical protein
MEQVACYDGPPATKDVGPCKAGTAICKPDGSGPGACMGEVLPAPDNCASKLNLHCDMPELACTGTPGMGGKSWGGPGDDRGLGIAIDSQGNAVVAGFFHGTIDFGDNKPIATVDMRASLPYSDAFVAQYDPKGTLRWVVPLGDVYDDQATAVAVGESDDVYVAGYFTDKITFATTPPSTVTGGPGIFVARLDKDGHTKWGRGYVGNLSTGAHVAKAIAVGPDGTMATAPPFTTAVFVVRLDNTGNALWGTAFTPLTGTTMPGIAVGTGVAADDYGVVVGGYFSDMLAIPGTTGPTSKGGVNGFAVKLAVDMGTVLWVQPFDDMPAEQVNGVALDPRNAEPLGASAVVGADKGDLANKYEAFLARLAP